MSRRPALLPLLVVVAVHTALTFFFEPPGFLLGTEPVAVIDYDTHFEQTLRALEAFRQGRTTWGYDPHLLAGSVSGAIFDADNKLHELFVILLDRFGVPPGRGFNLFILLAHLSLPFVVYASARLFDLDRTAATIATGLASMVWFFDAFSHWVFWVGMISYGFASYLAMLPIALFCRYLASRRVAYLAGVLALLPLIHHLHPYSFFILVVPMLIAYGRSARSLARGEHAMIVGVAVATVLANFWWLRAALRFWHYVLDSGFYLDATLSFLLTDYLGLLNEPSTTGVMAMRSSFRFLALGAAVFGVLAWRRDRDERFHTIGVPLVVLLAVAYVGGYLSVLRQVQPYRFTLPAIFLAAIPAASFLAASARSLRAAPLPAPAGALLGLAAIVALPRFARDVLYFIPQLVPRPKHDLPAVAPNINGPLALGTIVWPEPYTFRHQPQSQGERDIVDFVKKHDDGSGRWLVEWWVLGERLAWATDAQVLGGFRELNLAHSDANFFRRFPEGAPKDPAEVGRYLERYNVKWVIMSNPIPAFEARRDLLVPFAEIAGHRIYATRGTTGFIEGGGPGEVRAETNRITVRGSAGGSLVLRYHYLETLACEPGCTLRRVDVPGDRVGFLGVDGAPPDFTIVNRYR